VAGVVVLELSLDFDFLCLPLGLSVPSEVVVELAPDELELESALDESMRLDFLSFLSVGVDCDGALSCANKAAMLRKETNTSFFIQSSMSSSVLICVLSVRCDTVHSTLKYYNGFGFRS
jgi:hypothetical protein